MNAPYLLPASPWLISVLSYITLSAHLLMMNLTLGGSILCALYLFKAKEKHLVVAEAMAHRLPYFMAFTITFGIAPLLFVQTLYSGLFFTSAIYLSGFFLLILLNVFVSYILLYILSKKWNELKKIKPYLYLIIVFLLSMVLFIYNNLFTMMENSKDRHIMNLENSASFLFSVEFAAVVPRFLHFFFASVAISGLWVAVWGIMKLNREPEQGRWQYRSGATWFSSATILVIATGVWWLLDIPRESMTIVMGKSVPATILFVLLVISGLSSLILALLGMNSIKPSAFLRISAVLTIFNVVDMVVLRDSLRQRQLAGFYDLSKLNFHFQWELFLLFVLILAVVVFFCYDLLKRVRASGITK